MTAPTASWSGPVSVSKSVVIHADLSPPFSTLAVSAMTIGFPNVLRTARFASNIWANVRHSVTLDGPQLYESIPTQSTYCGPGQYAFGLFAAVSGTVSPFGVHVHVALVAPSVWKTSCRCRQAAM